MQNENTGSLDYKAELNRANEIIEHLKIDVENLTMHNQTLRDRLLDRDIEVAKLNGQIKAFEFCISRGNNNAE